jgi:hypothetical protein
VKGLGKKLNRVTPRTISLAPLQVAYRTRAQLRPRRELLLSQVVSQAIAPQEITERGQYGMVHFLAPAGSFIDRAGLNAIAGRDE